MKKVGILTFHYANNYGAVLQTWALRERINRFEGCTAEIINYVPESFSYKPYVDSVEGLEALKEKRKKFERFLTAKCGIDSPILNCVGGIDYDYYVVGSDQVWNLSFRQTEKSAYFFPGLDKNAVKVAYAASVGMGTDEANRYQEEYEQYLPTFKSLSVREREHVDFVEKMSGKKCECVLDPTLLLEQADYNKLIEGREFIQKEPYVLLFWLHNYETNKGIEFANMLARKYNLSIVHSFPQEKSYMFHKSSGSMIYGGVEDFLYYIKNAAFVVTNSFHASIFSLQFETPFYIFTIPSMQSRIREMEDSFGIGDRVVKEYIYPSALSKDVDFDKIKDKIAIRRKDSLAYLKNALDIEEMEDGR